MKENVWFILKLNKNFTNPPYSLGQQFNNSIPTTIHNTIRENFCIFCTINSTRTRKLRGSDKLSSVFKSQKTLHIIIKPSRYKFWQKIKTRFFKAKHHFNSASKLLNFSWIEHQMLLKYCLLQLEIFLSRHITLSLFIFMSTSRSIDLLFMWHIINFSFSVKLIITSH